MLGNIINRIYLKSTTMVMLELPVKLFVNCQNRFTSIFKKDCSHIIFTGNLVFQ